jgi:site-specific DNA recombinase
VYTRKSTEEGLEQEFNSLDAQRESAEAFIRSQTHEGWTCLPTRYDDGGFTGGNMERPALQRLLTDIDAGKIDLVVCYKVDRLSRSLLDFAKMMETFEQHGVSFVSVTQQFNTATSMGRLVLNVLLSFAQFEREIIAERTRDKMAATRRKGKWSVCRAFPVHRACCLFRHRTEATGRHCPAALGGHVALMLDALAVPDHRRVVVHP